MTERDDKPMLPSPTDVYDPGMSVSAVEALTALHRAELALVRLESERRIEALDRVRDGIGRLGEVGAPEGFLQGAADELGASSDFDRVVISEVRDGALHPHAVWVRDEAEPGATAARLEGLAIPLAYPLVEAEVAGRQVPAIVDVEAGARRTPRALRDALGWTSYVVVALPLSGTTAGMLHADAARPLDDVDLQVASLYADGLTRAFERAALHRTLQHHRQELRGAVSWMSERLAHDAAPAHPSRPARAPEAGAADGDGERGLGDLTAREGEVIGLLARGMTNMAIARALVISEGTVKYHVKNILRKLQATSRADAVAKYLRGPS
jgi:LuxR family transcriptional regulator, regulator of acetate metabolism